MSYQVELDVSAWGASADEARSNVLHYAVPKGFGVSVTDLTPPTKAGYEGLYAFRVLVESEPIHALEASIVVARIEDRFRGARCDDGSVRPAASG